MLKSPNIYYCCFKLDIAQVHRRVKAAFILLYYHIKLAFTVIDMESYCVTL